MKTIINDPDSLTATERKILVLIRDMQLFDKVEIKYSKQGELMWQTIKTQRGTYLRQEL